MNTYQNLNTELLPASIKELIDVIGVPASISIVEERGGVRLCVPKKANPEHWLNKLIGEESFKALVDYYQGEEIEIPRCVEALRGYKEQQILHASRQGASNAQLAQQFGYTERGIRKLRARLNDTMNSNQFDMFS